MSLRRQRPFTSRSNLRREETTRHFATRRKIAVTRQAAIRPEPSSARRVACDTSERSAIGQVGRYDRAVVRLFCVWMFLQSFYYKAIPTFRWTAAITLTPDRLGFVAMVLVFALGSRHRHRMRSSPDARFIGRAAAVFVVLALISWAVNQSMTAARFSTLIWIMNLAVYPAFAFFIATRLEYTKQMLTELLAFFAVFGAYLVLTAFGEHFNVAALVFPKYILDPTVGIHLGRSRGPFVDTINNGGMLIVSFLASACLSASLRGWTRLWTLVVAILAVPAVYFTETRGVWLALAAVIVTLVALQTRLRRTGWAIVALLFVAFFLGIGSKFSAFDTTLFSRRQNTIDYRMDNYRLDWNAFVAHPVFGIGYGNLWGEWRDFVDGTVSRDTEGLSSGNHSTVLGLLAELGVAGTIPFLAMVFGAAFVCAQSYRRLRGPSLAFEREIAVLALGALESLVVLSLTNDLKAMPVVNVAAFWFVGVISCIGHKRAESGDVEHMSRPTQLRRGGGRWARVAHP